MKILFLDDNGLRRAAARIAFNGHDFVIVETAADAIEYLKKFNFDMVSLDHDLGGRFFDNSARVDCGMEVVRWIVSNRPVIPTINIHSWNEDAANNMVKFLTDAGYNTIRRLFGDSGFVDGVAVE